METTQGNSCVAIFISNYQKCHVSLFIFYVFSSIKSENRRTEQVGGEYWHWWKGGGDGERGRRINMVQIMYTYVYICKCKNVPGIGGGEFEGEK
jgi:hypothetical protein